MGVVRSIQLFFQEGSSDKVYNAQIVEDGAGTYTVKVQWGRRGAALAEGAKAVKVARAAADKKFDALVREKTTKGYEKLEAGNAPAAVAPPVGHGSASKSGAGTRRAKVGLGAQLLEPAEEHEVAALLASEVHVAQQKLDGIRVLVTVGDTLVATNRDGQVTKLASETAIAGVRYLPAGTVVDGEIMGEEYWLFDVLRIGDEDVTGLGYLARWERLDELEPALTDEVRVLQCAIGAKAKQKLHDRLKDARAEGIVFKHRDAPYKAGRNATQRKHKFVKSCDVVVVENAGNAYAMVVYDGKKQFSVGKVFAGTTTASRKDLDARLGRGEQPVCEVKYLYATDDDQLFQPVFVRVRDDKPAKQCVRAQLQKTDRSVAS